ncbi:hypothetical protein OG874_12075 [Nocardia sp. NBC_00565]|uniref:hypothetical protein n=1 Tax=Nocardia sp. NBC_00565 TaxID=2975993 RepID=UPI002E81DE4D|nr:hypothetical protein [Nocardia sp. NBC_00565]WUC05823.1 hypothetical protein OG874_12075 [Nocardia sp. NBC_00565]
MADDVEHALDLSSMSLAVQLRHGLADEPVAVQATGRELAAVRVEGERAVQGDRRAIRDEVGRLAGVWKNVSSAVR